MMTGQEYLESIRNMKMHIFCMGEELETAVGHPILQPSLNSVRMTYDLAQDPEYRELMTASSTLPAELSTVSLIFIRAARI